MGTCQGQGPRVARGPCKGRVGFASMVHKTSTKAASGAGSPSRRREPAAADTSSYCGSGSCSGRVNLGFILG